MDDLEKYKTVDKEKAYLRMANSLSDFYTSNELEGVSEKNIKITDYNYLLVNNNNIITDISKGLVADMNEKLHSIKGQNLSTIVPY